VLSSERSCKVIAAPRRRHHQGVLQAALHRLDQQMVLSRAAGAAEGLVDQPAHGVAGSERDQLLPASNSMSVIFCGAQ